MSRMQARRLVVKSQSDDQEKNTEAFARQFGRICAPFAAAVMLFAQAPGSALAESVAGSLDSSLKRGQELGAEKLDFKGFFSKAKEGVQGAAEATRDASDPSKAATGVPQKIPTFGRPVETSAGTKKVAEDAGNKLNPFKPDTAEQAVEKTVSSGADKADAAAENVQKSVGTASAPGEDSFRQTAKGGTNDNTGSGSNSNAQATATPAFASKEEEKSMQKIEEYQKREEKGDSPKPRLDPSIVEGEPEPGPAPGVSNKLPEQPKPEPGSYTQLGKDSAGGKVQETKRGSGPLDLFGGGNTGETPTSKAEKLIEKSEEPQSGNLLDFLQKGLGTSSLPQDKTNNVASLSELEPPQPSEVIEKLPESSPGDQNDLPDQPAPEPAPPSALGKDSAGGATGSTKSGSGPLDFFGGSSNNQSALPQAKGKITLASNTNQGGFVYLLADGLAPPQPTELSEPEPEAAPGTPQKLPDQPRPEPSAKQTPADSAGGKTQDTKRGSGPLDLFGGSDSGDAKKSAEKNIQKAASFEAGNVRSTEVAQVAEEEEVAAPANEGQVVIIGILASVVLEIAIFSTYKYPEGHGGSH